MRYLYLYDVVQVTCKSINIKATLKKLFMNKYTKNTEIGKY